MENNMGLAEILLEIYTMRLSQAGKLAWKVKTLRYSCLRYFFDKSKSVFSITELKTTGLISGTTLLNLDGYPSCTINMTYPQLCKILFA